MRDRMDESWLVSNSSAEISLFLLVGLAGNIFGIADSRWPIDLLLMTGPHVVWSGSRPRKASRVEMRN